MLKLFVIFGLLCKLNVYEVIIQSILILFNNSNEDLRAKSESVPRFDVRDKNGIIFEPQVPRAGQSLTAECTVIGLTPENVKCAYSSSICVSRIK